MTLSPSCKKLFLPIVTLSLSSSFFSFIYLFLCSFLFSFLFFSLYFLIFGEGKNEVNEGRAGVALSLFFFFLFSSFFCCIRLAMTGSVHMKYLSRTAQSGSGCSLEDWCEVFGCENGERLLGTFNKEVPADRISHDSKPQPKLGTEVEQKIDTSST